MIRTRVVVLPSWYPTPDQPLAGSFVEEQVQAIADVFPTIELHVVAPTGSDEWISLRRPFAAARRVMRHLSAPIQTEQGATRNLVVHRSPVAHATGFSSGDHLMLSRLRLRRILKMITREYGPVHLIHAHVCYPAGAVASAIATSCGLPFILTEHQSPFPFPDLVRPDGKLPRAVTRALENASAVVSVSTSHAREITQFSGVSPMIIPNLCNETLFFPRLGPRPSRPFTFLAVGGLVPQKGFDVLLNAMTKLPPEHSRPRLIVVGTGKDENSLRAQAERLGIQDCIDWRGAVTRADLPNVYREADAFVLASRHESFGVVLIEAMASGLPIVATMCGGPSDIVTPETGILVESENESALAEALCAVMTREFSPTLIRASFLRTFSRKPVATKISRLYDQVLATQSGISIVEAGE